MITFRRFVMVVVLAIAGQLCGAAVAGAHPAAQGDPVGPITPAQRVDGMTGGDLFGGLLAEFYALPTGGAEPLCEQIGQTGKVLFAHRRFTCTVPEGTPVFLIGNGYFCDNVEPPPDFGADEAAQRACAHAGNQRSGLARIDVSIDGGKEVDIHDPRFEVYSPQMTVMLPPDNFLGIPPQPATFVVNGWVALVRHLSPGLHTIQLETTYLDGTEPDVLTRSIEVVRDR